MAASIWKFILKLGVITYMGPPYYMEVHQGIENISKETNNLEGLMEDGTFATRDASDIKGNTTIFGSRFIPEFESVQEDVTLKRSLVAPNYY